MTEIPAEFVKLATDAVDQHYIRTIRGGIEVCACGGEIDGASSTRSRLWEVHFAEATLAAVLPAHERMVREQAAAEILARRGQWRTEGYPASVRAAMATAARIARGPQDAPTAPVQPTVPDTPATETTTGTGGDTGDLSALCAELADRIRKAVRITPGDDLLRNLLDDTDPTAYLRLSGAEAEDAAHAVMPYVTLWQGRAEAAEQARADAWTIRDNYAAENRKLITERNTLKRDVIDASEEIHALTKRAETAEAALAALRDQNDRARTLARQTRPTGCGAGWDLDPDRLLDALDGLGRQ